MRSVQDMDDEAVMCHLERFHPADLRIKFLIEPGRTERYLHAPREWRTYHDTLHRLYPNNYEHTHEAGMDTNHDIKWVDKPESIWVTMKEGEGGWTPHAAYLSEEQALKHHPDEGSEEVEQITLHRPSLQPIYGGPTLLEALWNEMDRLMEALMTGETKDDSCKIKGFHGVPSPYDDHQADCEHWDNGDRYRAEELAWVIAIVSNPYEPSVDRVRAESMERWNASQEEK